MMIQTQNIFNFINLDLNIIKFYLTLMSIIIITSVIINIFLNSDIKTLPNVLFSSGAKQILKQGGKILATGVVAGATRYGIDQVLGQGQGQNTGQGQGQNTNQNK